MVLVQTRVAPALFILLFSIFGRKCMDKIIETVKTYSNIHIALIQMFYDKIISQDSFGNEQQVMDNSLQW